MISEARHSRSLFNLFQKLDFRDKDNSGKKKLFGILFAYLFSNTILSYNFFIVFDERSFVILSYTSNLFLLSILILSDFDNLFLASRFSDLFKTLPVKNSGILTAKFFSAVLFLLFFILSASIPQSVFFYFSGYSISGTIIFLFSLISFSYFAIGVLVFLYIMALKYFKSKAGLFVSFIQILFFVFVFYSSSLSGKAGRDLHVKQNILDYEFTKYLPQTFFSNSVYDISYFIICILLSFSIYLLLYKVISADYNLLLEQVSLLSKRKNGSGKPRFDFFNKLIDKFVVPDNYEKASFDLVKHELSRSKFLRSKFLPIMFMPLLIALIGLITNAPEFLFYNKSSAGFLKTVIPVISPSITFTLMMCSRIMISNTKILDSGTTETEWIYESLPINKKRNIIKGANKYTYVYFIFPVIVLLMILLNFKADFMTVFLNLIFITAGIYLINSIALQFDKTYPLTLESSRFSSVTRFFNIFFSIFLGVILFLIQIFIFQNTIFVIISAVVFIIIAVLINRN